MELEGIFSAMSYGPSRESADEATRWLKGHKNSFSLFIAGDWQAASGKDRFDKRQSIRERETKRDLARAKADANY